MSVASQSPRPAARDQSVDAELDFPALGAALWRKKWRILLPTLLVALVTLGVVQIITPKYLSQARVLIEGRDNVFLRPDADKDLIDRNVVDDQVVTSQVQLILSRDLAREVIAKLKLGENPEFDPALNGISPIKAVLGMLGIIKNPMSMTPEERVLESYYDRLNVYPVEKSRVIMIDFLSQDPDLAAKVANTIADVYLVMQRQAKQQQAQTAAQYLSGQIESMRRRVADAEAKVEAFRAKSNLLIGNNNTTLSAQQLGDFNTQLAAARAQKADAEAKAKIIREMLRSGAPIESSDVLNSELIRRLAEQRVTLRAQLAEQSSTLLDGHPRIKELKAQIADLDKQIRAEAETIARSFENDAKVAGARVDSQVTSFDQLKTQAATTNEQDVALRALEREAKSERDLLESYLGKYREATARDTISSAPANARVISRAMVSNIPAYPKKLPTVLIATLATFVLCCGFVVTRELLSAPAYVVPGRMAQRDVEPEIVPPKAAPVPEPVIGEIRPVEFDRAEARHIVGVPISAIDDVAYSLRHASGTDGRIAVVGAVPGLDTTRIALKLARGLAEQAHVVLVGLGAGDAEIRAASSEPSAGGLAELAAGTASFGEIITSDTLSPLHLIASGHTPPDWTALASSPAMATSFVALARSYDNVVFDAGAITAPEMAAIGNIAPHAILLAESLRDADTTSARERLLAAGFDDVTVLVGARKSTTGETAVAA
jgi:polysaccharide biosynthesis transport protein